MSETILLLWEFEDAPAQLRSLVPQAYPGWWLAFVHPEGADDIVESLVSRCISSGSAIVRREVENGGIVLAGPHAGRDRQ